MMNAEEKIDYRCKRNAWGWLIAAGWIIFWWVQKTDGSLASGASYLLMCAVAVVTAPFAFVISHYIARAVVEKHSGQRFADEEAALAAFRRSEADEQAKRSAALQIESQQTRSLIDRGEFIKKIGTVRDYLGVLAITTDDGKRLLVRQSIDKELRDLIVKHTPQAMTDLVQQDEAIRVSLAEMLNNLSLHGPLSADATILLRAQSNGATPRSSLVIRSDAVCRNAS